MPKYSYTAKDENGIAQDGAIEAASYELFFQKLKERGLFCLTVKEEAMKLARKERENKLKAKELALFCRQLGTMLEAGLSLMKALDVIYQQAEDKKWRNIVRLLYDSVQRGDQLSVALKRIGHMFPPIMIHMFEAGEKSGTTDLVSKRLADQFEKEYRIRHAITSALVYPAFLVGLTLFILILMLMFVLPTFASMFAQSGAELPALTRFVMGASDFLVTKWYVLLALLAVAGLTTRGLKSNDAFILWWDGMKLRIPVFGKLYTSVLAGRFARSLSSLISSGLPLLTALELTDHVVGNAYLSDTLAVIRDDIRRGLSFSVSIKKSDVFPVMLVSMIGIGEESGSLDSILVSTANIFDEESENAVKKMVTLLEPVMILFVACMVGLIVFAMVLPMFGLYSTLG